MIELFWQLATLFIGFVIIVFGVEWITKILKYNDALRDYVQDLIFACDQKDEMIAEADAKINELSDNEPFNLDASPYIVQFKRYIGKQAFVRVIFKSNKKIFLVSETYKNQGHAFRKAQQLANELNCELEIVEK